MYLTIGSLFEQATFLVISLISVRLTVSVCPENFNLYANRAKSRETDKKEVACQSRCQKR